MKECPRCRQQFDPPAYQIKRKCFICRSCKSVAQRTWCAKRKAAGNRVVTGQMTAEWRKKYYDKYCIVQVNKDRKAALERKRSKDPEQRHKYLARWKIQRKIASGKIKRLPCEICENPKSQAHHHDYSKPYDVKWLCGLHHREEHAKAGVE